jgi:hypothetical protein
MLAGLDIAWSRPSALAPVVLLIVLGAASLAAGLVLEDDRPLLGALIGLAVSSAFADLPVSRHGAAVEAAIAGGLLLVLAESMGWARAARDATESRGRPGLRRAAWTSAVAAAGGGLGWAATSLHRDLGGLGVGAVALGALGAVGCVALVAALARGAVSPR